MNNGIPIIPFYSDRLDRELFNLSRYLKELYDCKDIINEISGDFKMNKYKMYKNPSDVIE